MLLAAVNAASSGADVNGLTVTRVDFARLGSQIALGSYQQAGPNSWQETKPQYPKDIFVLKQDSRDQGSVYLSDKSRNVKIQINLARKKIMYSGPNSPLRDQYSILAFSAPSVTGGRGVVSPTNGEVLAKEGRVVVHYDAPAGDFAIKMEKECKHARTEFLGSLLTPKV